MQIEQPTSRHGHRAASVFIAVCLALEVGLPLSYYVAGGADERFAWRMFSSVGLRDCRAVLETVRPDGTTEKIDPFGLMGQGWVERLREGDPGVTRLAVRELCASRKDAVEAVVQHGCAGGNALVVVRHRCASVRNRS